MFVFHATVQAKPGMAEAYAERTIGASDAVTRAPGFIRRLLLRDREHDGVFFYISMWESEDHLQRYRDGEFVAEMRERASLTVLTECVSRVVCDVLVEESGNDFDS